MSVSVHAFMFYGVLVSRNKLTVETRTRGCGHPAQPGNFCPICGKVTWIVETEMIDDLIECPRTGAIGYLIDGDDAVVGINLCMTNAYELRLRCCSPLELEDIPTEIGELEQLLVALGINKKPKILLITTAG